MDDQNRPGASLFENRFHPSGERLHAGGCPAAPMLIPHVADDNRRLITGYLLLEMRDGPRVACFEGMNQRLEPELQVHHIRLWICRRQRNDSKEAKRNE